MDKKMVIAAAGIVVVLCAVAFVTASPRASSSPLYTMRMEQVSNKMGFSPAEQNNFTYTIEKGYNLEHLVEAMFGEESPETMECTCDCTIDFTCPWATCFNTCEDTCGNTCVYTCHTCVDTCGNTCVDTCLNTCMYTCYTCVYTCPNTCQYTCPGTCHITCDTCYTCD